MKINILRVCIVVFLLTVNTIYPLFAQTTNAELTYLHTDKSYYVAGDVLCYKLYVLDANNHKCSGISGVGYIVIRSKESNFSLNKRVRVSGGVSEGVIVLPDTLSSGLYEIIAFTGLMRNGDSKLLFRQDISIINRFDTEFNLKLPLTQNRSVSDSVNYNSKIELNKKSYGVREKVRVRLKNIDPGACLSVSVSEFSPTIIHQKTIGETLSLSDNSFVSNTKYEKIAETKDKILSGYVHETSSNNGVGNMLVLLSCVDSVPNLQYAVTDSTGRFHFALTDYYNGKDLYISVKRSVDKFKYAISLDNFYDLPQGLTTNYTNSTSNNTDFFVKCQNIFQINKTYKQTIEGVLVGKSRNADICPKLFYNKPVVINPGDFVSLNDFQEISVELLPQVKITKRESDFQIQFIGASSIYATGVNEPAVFLDGVYVDDLNKIMGLGSDKIKKIELFNVERVFGDLVFQGILAIYTKTNEANKFLPTSQSIRYKYDNYNDLKFVNQNNNNAVADLKAPYVKQLLYWEPNIITSVNGESVFEFFTSDNTAIFNINVEGITLDGKPINESLKFEVVNK